MILPSEQVAFDMYFASIVSFQHHPGAGTKEHRVLSITECRDIALEMMQVRRKVINWEDS